MATSATSLPVRAGCGASGSAVGPDGSVMDMGVLSVKAWCSVDQIAARRQPVLRVGNGFMSNTAMENQTYIDKRLTDLEIKSSYAEDLLDTLNQTVFRQQAQIDMLVRELRSLREQASEASGRRGLADDLPPHY